MINDSRTEVSVCIGTFDETGMPITISRAYSECATVAFQSITLHMLLMRSLGVDAAEAFYIHNAEGSTIRIERNWKGFTGYLEATDPIEA